jgi:hypothetical protein
MSYGKESHAINEGIKGGDAGKLKNNQAVREYAHDKYKEAGLTAAQIKSRMDAKDAGHIICGKIGTTIARMVMTRLQKQR